MLHIALFSLCTFLHSLTEFKQLELEKKGTPPSSKLLKLLVEQFYKNLTIGHNNIVHSVMVRMCLV